MRILITGHKGFIGSKFYSLCKETYPEAEIFGIDLKDGQDFVDLKDFQNEVPYDYLIHFAADVSVQNSLNDPVKVIENNSMKFIELLNSVWFKKVIFISTVGVYPEGENIKERDASWRNCKSPYALSKMIAEEYLIVQRCSCDYLILRLSNVAGDKDRDNPGVLNHFVTDDPIVVYGGEQTRDFISVTQVNSSIIKAMQNDITGIYTLASGKAKSIIDIAKVYADKRCVELKIMPPRNGEVGKQTFDISEARKAGLL